MGENPHPIVAVPVVVCKSVVQPRDVTNFLRDSRSTTSVLARTGNPVEQRSGDGSKYTWRLLFLVAVFLTLLLFFSVKRKLFCTHLS